MTSEESSEDSPRVGWKPLALGLLLGVLIGVGAVVAFPGAFGLEPLCEGVCV